MVCKREQRFPRFQRLPSLEDTTDGWRGSGLAMDDELGLETPPKVLVAEIKRLRALRDATSEGRRHAERDQRLLRAILQIAPVGLFVAEASGGRHILLNDEFKRMTGRTDQDQELAAHSDANAVHADGRPLDPSRYPTARALLNGEVVNREAMLIERPDGSRQRVEASSMPIHGAAGEIVAALTVLMDVEERECAQERQQLLIGELAHRMKNTLAMVQAIVSQTLRTAPSLEVAREHIMQRFSVLARAQDVLTRTSWDSALLPLVVKAALAPLAEGPERISLNGPDIRLGSRAALNFTLALHELGTNAVKYGALSTPSGQVKIDWRLEDCEQGERLIFRWTEHGGPPVAAPDRKGFGSRLIESLSRSFDADSSLAYRADGVSWHVQADLATLQQV